MWKNTIEVIKKEPEKKGLVGLVKDNWKKRHSKKKNGMFETAINNYDMDPKYKQMFDESRESMWLASGLLRLIDTKDQIEECLEYTEELLELLQGDPSVLDDVLGFIKIIPEFPFYKREENGYYSFAQRTIKVLINQRETSSEFQVRIGELKDAIEKYGLDTNINPHFNIIMSFNYNSNQSKDERTKGHIEAYIDFLQKSDCFYETVEFYANEHERLFLQKKKEILHKLIGNEIEKLTAELISQEE